MGSDCEVIDTITWRKTIVISSDSEDEDHGDGVFIVDLDDQAESDAEALTQGRRLRWPRTRRRKRTALTVRRPAIKSTVVTISSSDEEDQGTSLVAAKQKKRRKVKKCAAARKKMRTWVECTNVFKKTEANKRAYLDVFGPDSEEPNVKCMIKEKADKRRNLCAISTEKNIFDIFIKSKLMKDTSSSPTNAFVRDTTSRDKQVHLNVVINEAEVANALSNCVLYLDQCIEIGEEVIVSSDCPDEDEIDALNCKLSVDSTQCAEEVAESTQWFPGTESVDGDAEEGVNKAQDVELATCLTIAAAADSQSIPGGESLVHKEGLEHRYNDQEQDSTEQDNEWLPAIGRAVDASLPVSSSDSGPQTKYTLPANIGCRRKKSLFQSPQTRHVEPRPQLPEGKSPHVYRENLISLVEACIEEGETYVPLAMVQIDGFTTAATRPSFRHVYCLMNWLIQSPNIRRLNQTKKVLSHINDLHGMPPKLPLWHYMESAYLIDDVEPNTLGPLIKLTVFQFVCSVLETEMAHFDETKCKFNLTHVYRLLSVDAAFGNVKTLVAWLEDTIKLYHTEDSTALSEEDCGHAYSLIVSIQTMLRLCIDVSKIMSESIQRVGTELLKAYSRLPKPAHQHMIFETLQSDAVMAFVCEELLQRIATPPLSREELRARPCDMEKVLYFYFESSPVRNSSTNLVFIIETFVYLLGFLQLTQIAKLQDMESRKNTCETSSSSVKKSKKNLLWDYNERVTKLQKRLEGICPSTTKSSTFQSHFLNLRLALLLL